MKAGFKISLKTPTLVYEKIRKNVDKFGKLWKKLWKKLFKKIFWKKIVQKIGGHP